MERRTFIKRTGATLAALMCAPSIGRADKSVVKIGFIGPLTGPNAALGMGARNSADLAVRRANARGNLPYQLQLVVMDDASDPSTGVAVATKLCTVENVAAATAHFNSPVALATIHVFHRYKVPQVMWGTIHPDITNKHNFPEVTRVCATSIVEHAELMNFVVKERGYQRWSVLYDTTSYGQSCFEAAKKALQANGATILSEDGVPVGTQDFRPVLSRLKTLSPGPQAIYFGGVVTEAALLRLQMAEIGINDVLFTGVTGLDSDTFNKTAGNVAEGTLIVGKKAIGDDSEFVSEYKKAGYKEYYEASGPFAYDSTNLIIAAIAKAGPSDKAQLAKTIRGMDFNGVLGPTRFDEFGQTKTGGLTLKVSQAGKWAPWQGSDYARGARALPKK
ncbi:MAG: branched-chain amino acid ABC transporter substrate-binding protein [Hyphomicrobiaceae bacterium]|nr:branched-chain amino acid ABC transporter substrate-binding protein [Hyphomicrobiaceae bacterium]